MALFECLRCLLHTFPSLFELFASILHTLLILLLFHPLREFIGIAQHLLLLVAQTFELPFDFLPRFLRFCFLQSGLQLFDLFIEVFLSPREFLQAIDDLPHLTLLGIFLLLCLPLGFVTVLIVLEFQLLELLLETVLL